MWQRLKEFGKGVLRRMGVIQNLEKVSDHKSINISEKQYQDINRSKEKYSGKSVVLDYKSSTGKPITRERKSLNMPKVIAREMASLVFNEGVQIGVEEVKNPEGELVADKAEQWGLVDDVFTSNKFRREFQRYLEYMFAMGGMVVEVYTDGIKPKIAYADASAFFPLSNDSEEVDEAVIVNTFNQDGKFYTLLKWHEWGEWVLPDETGTLQSYNYRIKNELYEANNEDTIGDKVPLSRLYPDLEAETHFNLENALFIYIKPNEANNKYITSPLGISIFENAHDTIEMLDVMYDFWWNEFRMGKRRVAVPEYMVKTHYDAQGRQYVTIDDSEELFVALNAGEMNEFAVKDLTIDIRSTQVIESIQALLDLLALQTGFSPGTFTFDQGGIKTATQVVSENSKSYQTRSSHINVIEDGLRDLVMAVYEVAVMLDETGQYAALEPLERMDISIDFNDGVFTDQKSMLDFYSKAYKDGLIPLEETVKRIFKLSDDDAKQWVAAINQGKEDNLVRTQQAATRVELGLER